MSKPTPTPPAEPNARRSPAVPIRREHKPDEEPSGTFRIPRT